MSVDRRFVKDDRGNQISLARKRKWPTAGDYFDTDESPKRARKEGEKAKRIKYKSKNRAQSASASTAGDETSSSRQYSSRSQSSISDEVRSPKQISTSTSTSTSRRNAAFQPSLSSRIPEYVNKLSSTAATSGQSLRGEVTLPSPRSAGAESLVSSLLERKPPSALRIDTTKSTSIVEPRTPAATPEMPGEPLKDGRPRHAFPLSRPQSYHDRLKTDSILSRRQSDIMAPPSSVTSKSTRSVSSTHKLPTPMTGTLARPKIHHNALLFDTLSKFASSIESSAGLGIRQEQINQQLVTHQKERARNQRYETSFTTLIEQSEAICDAIEKSAASIESQIEQKSGDQAQISYELATNLEAPQAISRETLSKDNALIGEIAELKTELRKAREDISILQGRVVLSEHLEQVVHKSDLEQYIHQKDLEKTLSGLVQEERLVSKDHLDRYMKKYGFDPLEARIAEQSINMALLGDKMTKWKQDQEDAAMRNSKFLGNLTTRLDTFEQLTISDKTELEEQRLALVKLSTCIHGDSQKEVPGLSTIVEEGLKKVAKIQETVESNNTVAEAALTANSSSKFESIVATLTNNLEALKEEQMGKNDFHSSDLEKLEKTAKDQEESILSLKKGLEGATIELGRQWSHILTISVTSRPTQPPTPPLQSRAFTPQDADQIKFHEFNASLEELKTQTNALETTFSAQQQKFDGLTSEHVVQSMVNQMTCMYPSHASLSNQVGQISSLVNSLSTRQMHADHFLASNLGPWRLDVDKKLDACAAPNAQLLQSFQHHERKIGELTTAINSLNGYFGTAVAERIDKIRADVDRQKKNLDSTDKLKADMIENSNLLKAFIHRVNQVEAELKKDIERLMSELGGAAAAFTDLGGRRIISVHKAVADRTDSRSHIVDLGSQSDSEVGHADVIIRDSKSVDTPTPDHASDDSDAPLRGLKGRSIGRSTTGPPERGSVVDLIGLDGDVTTSPHKRKRTSGMDPDTHETARRMSGKGQCTGGA